MAPSRIVLKGLNNEGGFVLVGALLILLLLEISYPSLLGKMKEYGL